MAQDTPEGHAPKDSAPDASERKKQRVALHCRLGPKTYVIPATVKDPRASMGTFVLGCLERLGVPCPWHLLRAVAVVGLPHGRVVVDSLYEDINEVSLGGLLARAHADRVDIALLPRRQTTSLNLPPRKKESKKKEKKKKKVKPVRKSCIAKEERVAARRITANLGLSVALRAKLIALAVSPSLEQRTRFYVFLGHNKLLREYIAMVSAMLAARDRSI